VPSAGQAVPPRRLVADRIFGGKGGGGDGETLTNPRASIFTGQSRLQQAEHRRGHVLDVDRGELVLARTPRAGMASFDREARKHSAHIVC
jgi:hypothetical protein